MVAVSILLRVHTQVVGPLPSWAAYTRQPINVPHRPVSLSLSPPLPSTLSQESMKIAYSRVRIKISKYIYIFFKKKSPWPLMLSKQLTASSNWRLDNINLMQGLKGCGEEVATVTTPAIDAVTMHNQKAQEILFFQTQEKKGLITANCCGRQSNYKNRFHLRLKMEVQTSMGNIVLRSQRSPTRKMLD